MPSQVWDQGSDLGFNAPSCCLEIHNNFVFECVLLKSAGTMALSWGPASCHFSMTLKVSSMTPLPGTPGSA